MIVTQGLANSNGVPFSYLGPAIASMIPDAGAPGTLVSIVGQNLGDSQTAVSVSFGGVDAPVISRTPTEVQVAVPSTLNLGTAAVVLQVGGQPTNVLQFDVVQPPVLTVLTPNSGITGKLVKIFGSNFGTAQADSTVFFGEVEATPTSWSETIIQVPVPPGFYGGVVTVIVGGERSNGLPFVVPFRCFTDCNAQRTSISLSPQNLSVVVGEQVDLSVADNLGETVPFPTFSLSDSTLGSVSTTGNVGTLTALSPGTLTVTATVGSLTDSTTITIYPGPALPDGTIRWQLPASLVGVAEQFIPAEPAADSDTATFVRDDTFPNSDVVIRALNENGRELWAWDTGTNVSTLFQSPIVPTPNGGFVYTTQFSITSIDAQGHPMWSYPFAQYHFEPLTVGYDGTVYALVNIGVPTTPGENNFVVTHLVALDGQTGAEKFRIPLTDAQGNRFPVISRPIMLTDGSINLAVWRETNSISQLPNTMQAIPRNNSHDPQPQQGSTTIFCPSEVLECWAPVDPSTGVQETNETDTVEEQETTLVNIQPDGSSNQFVLSQSQIECSEFGTHYVYILDDNFLLPGNHVSGTIHDSNGGAVGDSHEYEELREAWNTGTCGVGPPGPNGLDLMVIPNGSGGVLVASETNDDQNPVWIKNVPAPSVSGDGTEIHLPTLDTINNLVVGENGNAFAAGTWNFFETPRLVSFNLNSGATNWSYDSPFGTPDEPGYVDIVAAGPNNSLYATEGDFFEQTPENAFTLDASGARTDNPTSIQAVTFVTSAGIGSNIWFGQNVTQLASLGGFDLGFGPPMLLQSGVQLGVPGITAFASTLVDPILGTFPSPSPSGDETCPLTVGLDYGLPVDRTIQSNVVSKLNRLFSPDVRLVFGSGIMQLNMSIETITVDAERQLESGVFGFVTLDPQGNPTNHGIVDYGKHLQEQSLLKASDVALGRALGQTIGHELGHELFLSHNPLDEGLMAAHMDPFVPNAFTSTDKVNIRSRCIFLQPNHK
ncbi:MAG TPA: IPT/TIG domain-containing protein [Candidatus Angelobacter sp.]|nr:IPT/TIG domain-containing protein [Candidatus Angelobacter sp.]